MGVGHRQRLARTKNDPSLPNRTLSAWEGVDYDEPYLRTPGEDLNMTRDTEWRWALRFSATALFGVGILIADAVLQTMTIERRTPIGIAMFIWYVCGYLLATAQYRKIT